MKVTLRDIGGEIVKNDETYKLEDNNYLSNLTYSSTHLNANKNTKGHSHEKEEEVYIFTSGEALMQIDDQFHRAKSDDVFLIKAGQFHRVLNKSKTHSCTFTCIFQKYDRSGNNAKYVDIEEEDYPLIED